MTEPIPIPVTSLLPIVLLPITGALGGGDEVVSAYGNDTIFLFFGGFFIALAMEKWNLHKRIAFAIISFVSVTPNRIILGFMIATAVLPMWVSNTAATMMIIPMGMAIVNEATKAFEGGKYASDIPKFEKVNIFGAGYAATIGGLGTLIGTPPLSILAAVVSDMFDVQISFVGWMTFNIPLVIVFLPILWLYLTRIVYRIQFKELPGGQAEIKRQRNTLGKISYEEKAVLGVFLFTAFMWFTRIFVWENIFHINNLSDGMIAIIAVILLYLIPAKSGEEIKLLSWEDSKNMPWGILVLFGGGLAIAAGFTDTGLTKWIGEQLTILENMHYIIIVIASTLTVLLLTEITSNTATGTMILPVVASLALALNIHPYALMVPCAVAANCAFMLPVGTPPNAIIFGKGRLTILEIVKNGFGLIL